MLVLLLNTVAFTPPPTVTTSSPVNTQDHTTGKRYSNTGGHDVLEGKGCKEFFSSFHFDLADMNQYYVTLYAPLVGVDRSILEYGVGTILAIYGKPLSVSVCPIFSI